MCCRLKMKYKLVNAPNLPGNSVKHCLIGSRYNEEIKELTSLGIVCLPLKENNALDDEIKYHADILSCNLGNGEILINQGSIGESVLKELGLQPTFVSEIQSPYPDDVALNCAVINNRFICNKKHLSTYINDFILSYNYQIIHTNQGYARCNLCIVKENAVITEDKGLASLLKKYQFDVLLVSAGDVYLSDKHNGFLGGASGKISETEIYFSGDLSKHRDYKAILNFLDKYNVTPVFNKSRILRDFGGFIQLTEIIQA